MNNPNQPYSFEYPGPNAPQNQIPNQQPPQQYNAPPPNAPVIEVKTEQPSFDFENENVFDFLYKFPGTSHCFSIARISRNIVFLAILVGIIALAGQYEFLEFIEDYISFLYKDAWEAILFLDIIVLIIFAITYFFFRWIGRITGRRN